MKKKIEILKQYSAENPTKKGANSYSNERAYGQLIGRYEMAGLGLEVIEALKKKNQELRKKLKQLASK